MEQGCLFDDLPELRFFTRIFEECKKEAKRIYIRPVDGEDMETFKQDRLDEARLIFCEKIRLLADKVEEATLSRQRNAIKIMYGGNNNEFERKD